MLCLSSWSSSILSFNPQLAVKRLLSTAILLTKLLLVSTRCRACLAARHVHRDVKKLRVSSSHSASFPEIATIPCRSHIYEILLHQMKHQTRFPFNAYDNTYRNCWPRRHSTTHTGRYNPNINDQWSTFWFCSNLVIAHISSFDCHIVRESSNSCAEQTLMYRPVWTQRAYSMLSSPSKHGLYQDRWSEVSQCDVS